MTNDTHCDNEYRKSHASPNYGVVYEKTYATGFYRDQWELIERPLLQSILSDLRKGGAETCLDFACGTGRITRVLEDTFSSVTGVDVAEPMLALARLNCSKTQFVQQDITKESLRQSFDVVTAFRFFNNAQPELRESALAAIQRSMHDNGRLVMNIHVNSSSLLGIAYRVRNRLKRRTVAKTCSFEEMKAILEQANFKVEAVFWYSFLPRIGWYFPRLSRFLMLPVERFASRVPLVPRRLAQSFIIVARKTKSV